MRFLFSKHCSPPCKVFCWIALLQIYNPSRLPPLSANTVKELASYGKTVVQGLAENLSPLYLQDIEDMKPCSGAVVQKGLEKVAVYVDEQGDKHAYRATCPHLGCLVQVHPFFLLYKLDVLPRRHLLEGLCAGADA